MSKKSVKTLLITLYSFKVLNAEALYEEETGSQDTNFMPFPVDITYIQSHVDIIHPISCFSKHSLVNGLQLKSRQKIFGFTFILISCSL